MKRLRLLLSCALAFTAVLACSDDEEVLIPNEPDVEETGTNEDGEHSDDWYALRATISSEDTYFTANDDGGTIAFKKSEREVVVNVDCGTDWTFSKGEDAEWLSVDVNGTKLQVSVPDATEKESRCATIELTTAKKKAWFATLEVTQNGVDALEITVGENSWHAPAIGALSTEIVVDSPTNDFECVSGNTWLSVEKSGEGIKLTVTENETTIERMGSVTVTCTNGESSDSETITVSQDSRAYISLSSESLTFGYDEDSQTVTVESNYGWTVTGPSDDWVSVTVNDGRLVVSVSDNENDEEREETFSVTAGDGAENTASATVLVTQTMVVFTLEYTIPSSGTTITLPLNGTVNCTIDWGDGSEEEICTEPLPTHTYAFVGVYDVAISGTATEISHVGITVSTATDNDLTTANTTLTAVKSWGSIQPTTFAAAFSGCTALKTLPKKTNYALSKPTSFNRSFYYCESLESIPEDLFAKSADVTTMERTFMYCYALKEIPDGLFDNCKKLSAIVNTFRYTSIEKIPDGIFDGPGESLTQLSYAFANSDVAEYPDDLFSKTPNVTIVRAFFNGTKITRIPKGLFDNLTKLSGQHDYLFYNTPITEVPEGLFDNFAKVTTLARAFYGCTELVSVPTSLFDKVSSTCTDLTFCFYNCSQLKGESPYYMDGNTKVHLYDRTYVTSHDRCFYNCKKLDDYDDIPDDWKVAQ